ncbi:zinc finger, C2H2 type family protein (macronuclear) [Tetrahymena thermophila SB210]|uniref:Zinc finger, C2H2 type family protein n=1 Tax=Tetrahymena thermophila (strain SB210) TaxID=312017 RepID=I7MI55_TETTS|nr:zinc finger, C2H2 type family protein [Tetrahymena thermophila SB210]EAS03907.1 zinc finger, C2H2 type family protein [Tetrahymena thermophila SB210]|eukprot:XP_001024152.1 zinc finger, C2H2 type family protein [Tetrahymena thermophila SB210]
MEGEDRKQYPLNPPDDQILKYEPNLAILKMNPKGIDQKAKFCPVCDFPINVRIVAFPCCHYYCYSCYVVDTFQCRLCDILIKESKRMEDGESFYSCDNENCYKYFENQEKYEYHMKFHQPSDRQSM